MSKIMNSCKHKRYSILVIGKPNKLKSVKATCDNCGEEQPELVIGMQKLLDQKNNVRKL